jgi:hypothetical protein
MKALATFRGLKPGTKLKVIACSNSHNYPVGKVFTLKKTCPHNSGTDLAIEFCGNNIAAYDCVLVGNTLESLKKERDQLRTDIKEIDDKISMCESLGLEEYSDDILKVATILDALDNKKISKEKKIKTIVEILNK